MTAFICAGRKRLIRLGKFLESLKLFRFSKARQATFYDALMQHDGFFPYLFRNTIRRSGHNFRQKNLADQRVA